MTITNNTTHTQPIIQTCCISSHEQFRFQKTLESVCRLAIGVFAAIYAPASFLASLHAGLVTGMAYSVYQLYQKKPIVSDGENKPVCAQGYMDFLSGMRFPPPAGTLATAVFIAAHTRHDPSFYAPFCGLFIGFWFGKQGALYTRDLLGYTVSCFSANSLEVKQKVCCGKIKI